MLITFVGNFSVLFSSENHHARSLESLGHTVIQLQENKTTTSIILENALKSDLMVWVKTHGWNTPGKKTIKEVINILRANNIPTISYHLDLYMGIERWNEYKDSPLFDLDYFFTVDKQMAEWLNKNTKCKGYFIPAGVFDKEVTMEPYKPVKDIAFVGSRGYHPEWPWRPQLIDWLKETYGNRFEHWGGDGKGVLRGKPLNILYASTKIIIGDTLSPNFEYPYYFSDRVWETMGRGGFIIFPRIKGLDDYFKEGKDIVYYEYSDLEGLKKKIDYYLDDKNADERERIRRSGHEKVKSKHTYRHRWEEILKVVFG